MKNKNSDVFNTLVKINVNDKIEKKQNLSYLSWAWAWTKVKEIYPNSIYTVWKDENGNPYTFDENLGFMCYTTVTIEGETLEMWLPVMDGANKAMKKESYTYTVKDWGESRRLNKNVTKEKNVEPASMFDINKTIMRCLVKNLAMFGLGIYIYAGEDLPKLEPIKEKLSDNAFEKVLKKDENYLKKVLKDCDLTEVQQSIIELKLKID